MAWKWMCAAAMAVITGCATGNPVRLSRDAGRDDASEIDAATTDDAGPIVTIDAYVPPGTDGGPIETLDAYVPPGTDGGPPRGTGAYLDRCTGDGNCASGRCADDYGGTRFCSRSCTADAQCAHEHLCNAGFCAYDDTGSPCSTATPESCAAGLCLGSAAGGRCTRECGSAAECPAGYACTQAGGSSLRVCVDIELPCTGADQCGTGLCIPGLGCTAACRSASDCPARLTSIGLPPYSCAVAFSSGTPICVPPDDVLGDDAAGAPCPASGLSECRSGACDPSAPLGPMCIQACTAQGGCAPGLGCYPLADDGAFLLVCELAGSGDLGESCGGARECRSGLCDASGYCTRLCADGLCPTGMSCMPVPGSSIAICRR